MGSCRAGEWIFARRQLSFFKRLSAVGIMTPSVPFAKKRAIDMKKKRTILIIVSLTAITLLTVYFVIFHKTYIKYDENRTYSFEEIIDICVSWRFGHADDSEKREFLETVLSKLVDNGDYSGYYIDLDGHPASFTLEYKDGHSLTAFIEDFSHGFGHYCD